MNPTPLRSVLLASSAALALCAASCGDASAAKPSAGKPASAPKTEWSPGEMAADPEGYLVWARERLDEQKKVREDRLRKLADRRKEIEGRRAKFAENVEGCERIVKLMGAAVRRADDEDRWPASMGGRTFERDKADLIMKECRKRVEERAPFLQVYDEALAKLDQGVAKFKQELGELAKVREKVELDLERIRLSQGIAELAQLKRTESEIAHFSGLLAAVVEDTTPGAPVGNAEPPPVDLDALLK
jgi:hypothetical protein